MKIPEATAPASKEDVYVTIPAKDILQQDMPTFRINTMEFPAGKTYLVTPDIGGELQRLMANYQASRLALISARQDAGALHTALTYGSAPTAQPVPDER